MLVFVDHVDFRGITEHYCLNNLFIIAALLAADQYTCVFFDEHLAKMPYRFHCI